MQHGMHLSRRTSELWLTSARAALALALALSIALSSYLHLEGMIGTLGMYAVTDGVLAFLSPHAPARARYAWAEGTASCLFGLIMMVWVPNERMLLLLFCMRNVLVAGAEVMLVFELDRKRWYRPQNPRAFFAYAGISAAVLSLSYMVMSAFGYGALEMHACLGGQLGIWAALVFTYMLRLRRSTEPHHATYLSGGERVTWP